jgi:molecular chaperone DnaK (HSP70)
LSADIRHALASALDPIGISEMKFTLELKRRKGRGRPRKDIEGAVEAQKLTNRVAEDKSKGVKQEALIAGEPGSRSKKFSQMRVVRKIRERK